MNYFLLPAIVEKSLPVFIAVSVKFLPYLLLKFVPVFIAVFINFLPYLLLKFLAKDEKTYPFIYLYSVGSIEYHIFIFVLYYLIIKVTFILSSSSNGALV